MVTHADQAGGEYNSGKQSYQPDYRWTDDNVVIRIDTYRWCEDMRHGDRAQDGYTGHETGYKDEPVPLNVDSSPAFRISSMALTLHGECAANERPSESSSPEETGTVTSLDR